MSIFDPERRARTLSIAGTLCVVGGLYSGADAGWAVALAGVALLLAACYSRRDGFLLFGPFARADAVRSARSRRTHLVRAGIVLAAGAVIVLNGDDFLPSYVTQWSRTRQSTYVNEQIVGWFAGSVAVLLPCLTVLLVSGAIAEERAAKRWEVLLTTDLRGRELVFGKLLGKLWLVVEPVVVILPVLAILPLIVGLSPALMLLFGGAVFVTVLALAGLSALFSSTAKARSRAAGVVVLLAFGYLCLCTGSMLLRGVPEVWTWPRFQGYDSPATVADLVEAFNAANPFTTLYIHGVARPTAGPPMVGYVAALRQYSAGALGVFLVGTLLACQRVRSVRDPNPAKGFASRPIQLFGRGKPRETVQENQAKLRPPVTDEPLAWWANCRVGITGPTQRRKVAQVFAQMLAVFLSSYAIDLVGQVTLYPWLESIGLPVDDWAVSAGLLVLVSFVAPVVLTVALVAPVAAATRSIAAERAGDTLDPLRLTPLSAREMLSQIRGGCLQMNRVWVWVWSIPTAAAVVTGFFPLHVAIVLALLALVLASPLVSFALYCSAWASTPAQAVRNLIFGGVTWHYFLLFLGMAVFLAIPEALGLSHVTRAIGGNLIEPGEFVQLTLRTQPGPWLPTGVRVAFSLVVYGGSVCLYYLAGRWVFNRAIGRFARSRDASA